MVVAADSVTIIILNGDVRLGPRAFGVQPSAIPSSEEDFDICGKSEVFDVPSDAFPMCSALVERLFDMASIAKVHPVNEEVEGGWIGDWQEQGGMVRWGRHEAG